MCLIDNNSPGNGLKLSVCLINNEYGFRIALGPHCYGNRVPGVPRWVVRAHEVHEDTPLEHTRVQFDEVDPIPRQTRESHHDRMPLESCLCDKVNEMRVCWDATNDIGNSAA